MCSSPKIEQGRGSMAIWKTASSGPAWRGPSSTHPHTRRVCINTGKRPFIMELIYDILIWVIRIEFTTYTLIMGYGLREVVCWAVLCTHTTRKWLTTVKRRRHGIHTVFILPLLFAVFFSFFFFILNASDFGCQTIRPWQTSPIEHPPVVRQLNLIKFAREKTPQKRVSGLKNWIGPFSFSIMGRTSRQQNRGSVGELGGNSAYYINDVIQYEDRIYISWMRIASADSARPRSRITL